FEFCQRDCCSDPCYEAVYDDQGWDGLLLLLRYKVGCSDSLTQQSMLGCWVSFLKRQLLHVGEPAQGTGSPTYARIGF
ncbi:hypothetical protein, partial [Nostoc sp. FACHB-110]|uniref:hypothetical protein n=1 Tax=Nostoc sp. FACHB-110 TaxID=2692834 RepID=UPI001A7E97FD